MKLRAMEPDDWAEVADLVYVSLNYWYAQYGEPPIFRGGPSATRVARCTSCRRFAARRSRSGV